MSWTDLTFTGSHILTASDMNRLQGNFSAMAAGEAGAPPIAVNSLMATGVASIDTLYSDSAYVDLDADRIASGVLNQARVPFEAPGPIGFTTPADIRAKWFEAGPGSSRLAFNAYFSDGWKYRAGGNAALINIRPASESGGKFNFSLATSGSAGGAVSWTTFFEMQLAGQVIQVDSGATITKEGESWTGLSFSNNWTNQGGSWQNAQYIKDAFGYVHVRGVVKRTVAYADTVIATLPAGYRPAAWRLWRTSDPGRLTLKSTGDIFIQGGAQNYMTLDGIVFEAA